MKSLRISLAVTTAAFLLGACLSSTTPSSQPVATPPATVGSTSSAAVTAPVSTMTAADPTSTSSTATTASTTFPRIAPNTAPTQVLAIDTAPDPTIPDDVGDVTYMVLAQAEPNGLTISPAARACLNELTVPDGADPSDWADPQSQYHAMIAKCLPPSTVEAFTVYSRMDTELADATDSQTNCITQAVQQKPTSAALTAAEKSCGVTPATSS